jgi:hypothetical protein
MSRKLLITLATVATLWGASSGISQSSDTFTEPPDASFTVNLPMLCTNTEMLFGGLGNLGFKPGFVGSSMSTSGSDLFVSVLVHPTDKTFYVTITNKMHGGTCMVTNGTDGTFFKLMQGSAI